MDFFDYNNNKEAAKGKLLVSEPFLPDPNFGRTVVLLCDHNEDGSFGFVTNKQANLNLDQLIKEVDVVDIPVFIGGPVEQNTLHYIHSLKEITGGIEIAENIYWGGDFEETVEMVNNKQITNDQIKFFAGYSGWGEGQLATELKENSWIVCDLAKLDWVFARENIEIWKEVLKSLGGRFDIYSNYPEDPRLN